MIDAFENVHKTGFDETQRGLMPAWIQRYQAGVATNSDVLDAQSALLQANLDLTRALANVRLAHARLERALGR